MISSTVSRRHAIKAGAPLAVGLLAAGAARAGVQPAMRAALRSLRTAHDQLSKGTADKGGHRAKAMALVSQAIEEVEKGIRFDNNR